MGMLTTPERVLLNSMLKGVRVLEEPVSLTFFRDDNRHGCDAAAKGLIEKGYAKVKESELKYRYLVPLRKKTR